MVDGVFKIGGHGPWIVDTAKIPFEFGSTTHPSLSSLPMPDVYTLYIHV